MTVRKQKKMPLKLKNIDLIVYDFDGVLTDNRVLVFDDGHEAVFCSRADGLAIGLIKKAGIPQIILSMEENRVVETRARKLGIDVLYGIQDKKMVLTDYCRKNNYDLRRELYIGNDINDLEVMGVVGHPLAPQDARPSVKRISKMIIARNGGDGVVRELFGKFLNH